jgi:hypothetical protein
VTFEQMLWAGAAAVVALWPQVGKLWAAVTGLAKRAPSVGSPVSYEAAIHDLAVVRTRLMATGVLDDGSKKAIDTLTLALVAGSDK